MKKLLKIFLIIFLIVFFLAILYFLFFSRNLISKPPTAEDLSDDALREIALELFSEKGVREKNTSVIVLPPSADSLSLRDGDEGQLAFGVKNLANQTKKLNYKVLAREISHDCNADLEEANNLIKKNSFGSLLIPSSGIEIFRVYLEDTDKVNKCSVVFLVSISNESGELYDSENFLVRIK